MSTTEDVTESKNDKTESKQSRTRGLIKFEKGKSGNPKGRPTGSVSITLAIKRRLEEIYPGKDNKEKKTYLEMIVDSALDNAVKKGDQHAINKIWAYVDGQPKATIDIGADKSSLAEMTEFFRVIGKSKK